MPPGWSSARAADTVYFNQHRVDDAGVGGDRAQSRWKRPEVDEQRQEPSGMCTYHGQACGWCPVPGGGGAMAISIEKRPAGKTRFSSRSIWARARWGFVGERDFLHPAAGAEEIDEDQAVHGRMPRAVPRPHDEVNENSVFLAQAAAGEERPESDARWWRQRQGQQGGQQAKRSRHSAPKRQ